MDMRSTHRVIANCEDEYAVWPDSQPRPAAWRDIGVHGTREACRAFIEGIDAAKAVVVRHLVEQQSIRP